LPDEKPLGFSVNDQEVVGEPFEVEASKGGSASVDVAAGQTSDTTAGRPIPNKFKRRF